FLRGFREAQVLRYSLKHFQTEIAHNGNFYICKFRLSLIGCQNASFMKQINRKTLRACLLVH
ncbi:MAG: hypothetical protein K2I11_04835, partial [Bacteroides sp.]|nr:hypothetical protein [Bacteroides sp.]